MALPQALQRLFGEKQSYHEVDSSDEVNKVPRSRRISNRSCFWALLASIVLNILTLSALLVTAVRDRAQSTDGNALLKKTSAYCL